MDVNWEYGFPEFLAAEDLERDERRLIATSLHNPVMPFIRYQTDDIVRVAEPEADRPGLYPKIRSIAGRKDECILTPEGGRLPSLNFYSLLQTYTDILKFQFVQKDLRHVTMKVAVRPSARDVDAMVGKLHEELVRRLGTQMSIEIEQTEEFERSADGKTPAFKRLFRPVRNQASEGAALSLN
jgi:phenylacetate-CoA ligase